MPLACFPLPPPQTPRTRAQAREKPATKVLNLRPFGTQTNALFTEPNRLRIGFSIFAFPTKDGKHPRLVEFIDVKHRL